MSDLRSLDGRLLGAALALSLISVGVIASAGAALTPALAWRQAMWVLVGLLVSIVVAQVPCTRWTSAADLAYAASLILLGFVLLGGATRLGATRWISLFGLSVQPVELAKLSTIWWLARYLSGQPLPLGLRTVLTSLGVIGLGALFVFKQPDLGSATVLMAIWFGMIWAGGLSAKHLMAFGGAIACLVPFAWNVLRPYQRDRLMVFVDPHADPLGAGYSIIQSQIAIGSGQWAGRGWFQGTQNQLKFLPERHSDFLFSVIGEEWGMIGCLVVLGVMVALLIRILQIAVRSSSPQGRLIAVGVFSWIAYQAFVNMAMVMGLLPVVGIPLPLVSYGGSSMVSLWVAVGLVQQIHIAERHRSPTL